MRGILLSDRALQIERKLQAWLPVLSCLIALLSTFYAGAAPATPVIDLQNYRVQSFTTDGGLSVDSLLHVTRLLDGRVLIVGTRGQPVIFDGVRFSTPVIASKQVIDRESGARMSLQTPDGALWFASRKAGLLRLKGAELRQISTIETSTLVLSLDQKRVMVGTRTGIIEFDARQPGAARLVTTLDVIVLAIVETADGALWIATADGLFVLSKGAENAVRFSEPRLSHAHVWALLLDSHGRLLIGTRGLGLAILATPRMDAALRFIGLEHGLPHLVIRSITESGGAIWLATAGGGVARMLGEKIEIFDSQNGLTSDTVTWITADQGGVIWVATAGAGLNRLWPSPFRKITDQRGRSGGFFYAIHRDPRGRIWLGSNRGLSRVEHMQIVETWLPGEGQASSVVSIVDDSVPGSTGDQLLVGTRRGVFRYFIKPKRFELIASTEQFLAARLFAPVPITSVESGSTNLAPSAMSELAKLFEWPLLAQQNQLYAIKQANLLPIITLPDGADITDIARHYDQTVLIASTQGLFQFDGTRLTPVGERVRADALLPLLGHTTTVGRTRSAGRTLVGGVELAYLDATSWHALRFAGAGGYRSALRQISGMALQEENVWITTGNGLYRMPSEVLARASAEISLPAPQQFMLATGLASTEFEAAAQGALVHEEKVWLASTGGVIVLDPTLASLVPIKMSLSMREIEAEQNRYSPQLGAALKPKVLPAGTRRVRLRFAALPASHAQSLAINFRLLPVETQFRSDEGQREAVYAALAPGEYQFELRAALVGAQFTSVPLSYHFSIAPKPIERKSVQVALALGFLLALSALPALHIFGLRRQKRRLTDEVSEKTQALEHLARTDSLTNLANRRFFDEQVQTLLAEQALIGLLLIDIDFFKGYNDHYGHQAGDACLRAVSACLENFAIKWQLFAARIGGEEFALLLSKSVPVSFANASQASEIAATDRFDVDLAAFLADLAAQLCVLVHGLKLAHSTSELGQVTISVGAALAQELENPDVLIQRCDAALYQAKAAGRNRWKLAAEQNFALVTP